MTDEFVASNGYKISRGEFAKLVICDEEGDNSLEGYPYLDEYDTDALREYFQAEDDKRLGRWRWPENPDYVVYSYSNGWVHVVREGNPFPISFTRGLQEDLESDFRRAARAYFTAHPEPKPWENAKIGDIWLLTVFEDEAPYRRTSKGWELVSRSSFFMEGNYITAGERIYPKDAS